MAYDSINKRLYATAEDGITLSQVSRCLGDYRGNSNGQTDLGMMCTSPKINKWAMYKPVRFNSFGVITLEQRKSVRCGLQAVSVSKILTQSIGSNTSSSTAYTKDECLGEVMEWPYLPPRGVVANSYQEWFRLLDFDGYEHDAVAPDGAWGKITFKDDTIDELINTTITVRGSGYDFEMTPSTNSGLYSTFAMKFNQASGVEIGTTDKMDISISDIASIDGNYRIAMAVWIPNFGESGGWGFFASRMTIGQYTGGAGDNMSVLYPDFATNQYAMYHIKSYYEQTNIKSFLAVPLLVKDFQFTYATINGKQLFYLRPVDVSNAYCMPSGQKEIGIYFDIVSAADVVGATVVKFLSPSGWYVAYKYNGNKVNAPGNTVNLNSHTLFVGSVRPIENNVKVTLTGTIRYRTPNDPATEQTTSLSLTNQNITAGKTIDIDGVTYYGIDVRTMPELTMKEGDVTTFTVTEA